MNRYLILKKVFTVIRELKLTYNCFPMKRILIVFLLLLVIISANLFGAQFSMNTAGEKPVGKASGTQVDNHASKGKEELAETKKSFFSYVEKVQQILKTQYRKLLVFESPLNTFFKKINLFGIQDFTPYIILALAVVLGLFHFIRNGDSYSGVVLFIYVVLFIVAAVIQILYVYAHASEGIWILDHRNVGWLLSALSLLVFIFVIYAQMASFGDILADLETYSEIYVRYLYGYIAGFVAFVIGVIGYYFFSKLLVLSFFIFLSSVLIHVLIILIKGLKVGNWKYGLFISAIYILGIAACLLLCVKFLNEFLIASCVIIALAGGGGSKSVGQSVSYSSANNYDPPYHDPYARNRHDTDDENPYAPDRYEIEDEDGRTRVLTPTFGGSYVDEDNNPYTETLFGGSVTRDNPYSDDD